ncbi:MAG: glycosyltransferase [Planctomycetota bacterium]|jgi:glycosyltransferase involved in cell wall biosynthesis
MQPLRIVHALPFFDPATRFGGPVAQLRRVCQALAERGHVVRVIATELDIGPNLPREQWLPRDGYQVWYCRVGRVGHFAPYYAPRARRALVEALRDADVLDLSLSFTHFNVMARKLACALGVPYVYTPRSCLDPVRLRQRRLSKIAFLALFERKIIRDATAIRVLTETEREQVVRQGGSPDRCVVIPNAAELDEQTRWPDGGSFRGHFDIPSDVPVILFLGRLHSIKGIDLLVEAFARACGNGSRARLVIAGPDEGAQSMIERRAHKLKVAHAVQLVGRVDGDLRLAALRAADIFALTSHSEGLSNAVLEACASGTPVLITDRCNTPEVTEYDAGCVVPPRTEEITEALRAMLADPQHLAAMGANGPRLVRERFALPAVIERIEAMYQRIAGLSLRGELRTGALHEAPVSA